MKIKMNSHFQGRHEGQEISPLQDGKTYEVSKDLPESLAAWLISTRKATEVKYLGSQPLENKEPELKHDDVLTEVQEVVEVLPEQPPESQPSEQITEPEPLKPAAKKSKKRGKK